MDMNKKEKSKIQKDKPKASIVSRLATGLSFLSINRANSKQTEASKSNNHNPTTFNQYSSPESKTSKEQKAEITEYTYRINNEFREKNINGSNYSEQEQLIATKTNEIIANICKPELISYFKEVHGIDLGNMDLSINQFDFKTKDTNEGQGIYVAMYSSSKLANDTMIVGDEFIKRVNEFKALDEENIGYIPVEFVTTITHELLHKMFNLDNRLDIEHGSNEEAYNMSPTAREGLVEYFARKSTIHGLQKSTTITPIQKEKYIKSVTDNIIYKEYVDKLENSIKNLTIKYTLTSKNIDFKQNKIYIEKLLANFFLSGDDKIIELAKSLGLKNILSD
jgi:hypothetical protein